MSAPDDCGLLHDCRLCPRIQTCTLDKRAHEANLLGRRLSAIRHRVLVMSNKGGVGKSTVTANLAVGLARRGLSVGVADADVHGPNQPRMFGGDGYRVRISERGLKPFEGVAGVKVGSIGFLLRHPDDAVVWRDAFKWEFLHQLLSSFDWGELDLLLVDLPPGTGNESITMMDLIQPLTGVILVTSPQQVSLLDVRKAASFCRDRGTPILGLVENFAGVDCPSCGHHLKVFPEGAASAAADELGIEPLARIPILPALAAEADAGRPLAASDAGPFAALIESCLGQLAKSHATEQPAAI